MIKKIIKIFSTILCISTATYPSSLAQTKKENSKIKQVLKYSTAVCGGTIAGILIKSAHEILTNTSKTQVTPPQNPKKHTPARKTCRKIDEEYFECIKIDNEDKLDNREIIKAMENFIQKLKEETEVTPELVKTCKEILEKITHYMILYLAQKNELEITEFEDIILNINNCYTLSDTATQISSLDQIEKNSSVDKLVETVSQTIYFNNLFIKNKFNMSENALENDIIKNICRSHPN